LPTHLCTSTHGYCDTAPYKDLAPPTSGDSITMKDGRLEVPNEPIIPFIEGDGTGPDIWRASQHVFDSAVQKAYGGKRRIAWFEVLAGRIQGEAR
jgi:isocitrate dehydrogenase